MNRFSSIFAGFSSQILIREYQNHLYGPLGIMHKIVFFPWYSRFLPTLQLISRNREY